MGLGCGGARSGGAFEAGAHNDDDDGCDNNYYYNSDVDHIVTVTRTALTTTKMAAALVLRHQNRYETLLAAFLLPHSSASLLTYLRCPALRHKLQAHSCDNKANKISLLYEAEVAVQAGHKADCAQLGQSTLHYTCKSCNIT